MISGPRGKGIHKSITLAPSPGTILSMSSTSTSRFTVRLDGNLHGGEDDLSFVQRNFDVRQNEDPANFSCRFTRNSRRNCVLDAGPASCFDVAIHYSPPTRPRYLSTHAVARKYVPDRGLVFYKENLTGERRAPKPIGEFKQGLRNLWKKNLLYIGFC